MSDVTISLACHNQRNNLERLLPTLLPAAERVKARILMVECRSTDGTREFVQTRYPSIEIMSNPSRGGYGINNNLNLQKTQSRYFVVMNSDTTVTDDTFVILRDYMDSHPDVGIAAPKILNFDGTIQELNKRELTVLDILLRFPIPGILRPFVQGRIDYFEMRDIGYEHECEAAILSGCFLFCRTDVLKAIGGFDENFYHYFDDIDLCRRVQRTHRTVYYPNAVATHFWARMSRKNLRYTWYYLDSARRYFNKFGWRWF